MIATELSHIQLAMYNGVHEVSVLGQLSHLLCDIASHVLLQVAKPTFDQLANFQSEENFCVMRVSKNQQMNTGGLVRACVIGSFSENASNFKNEKKKWKNKHTIEWIHYATVYVLWRMLRNFTSNVKCKQANTHSSFEEIFL